MIFKSIIHKIIALGVFFTYVAQPQLADAKPAINQIKLSNSEKSLSLLIDCSTGCYIKELYIKGKNVLAQQGAFTGFAISSGSFTSLQKSSNIKLTKTRNGAQVSGIKYGTAGMEVLESWQFSRVKESIIWTINRSYINKGELVENFFPKWNFENMGVWKGGILDNGGMVWCKYLKQNGDSYGVHTSGATFWNQESGDGFQVIPNDATSKTLASKFSNEQQKFTFTQMLSEQALLQKHDLSRFVQGHTDIFRPFSVKRGNIKISLQLSYIDYERKFSRGNLVGIDSVSVRELMNTTGRYGVVDNGIVGANGWLTNWKCLHEPFFAQIGLGLNDQNYEKNLAATLDQEQQHAMTSDGRVLSRWHNAPGDEIKGTYNRETGYYEAMWGYTIDSQTGYIINTSEQFDLSGDLTWLKKHQLSCEKALDWLIKRDQNNNGIFEMINNSISEKKASDWLDIVWASYENAFVNAQMYEALRLWSKCEEVLGNHEKSKYYAKVAARLKSSFNKPIADGGFWSQEKKQYIYWRDRDGSIHGDNLVTPVNFAAIAFGICDDPVRVREILDQIEQRTSAENLFHWPLCFDSFKREEVHSGNWPFPKYENGDIFPTWGYLGVRAYTQYDKSIALKYINNLLIQYKKDGLSSQRYSRFNQLGLGDDVLAGISTSITALYRDIYGIRPKWNRFGLEPNIMPELAGTRFTYHLRKIPYSILLNEGEYQVSGKGFEVISKEAFGIDKKKRILKYYHRNLDTAVLNVRSFSSSIVKLKVNRWSSNGISISLKAKGKQIISISGMRTRKNHVILINDRKVRLDSDKDGTISFNCIATSPLKIEINPA